MISAAFPGFLLAGGLFAVVPIALHMLARRPPDRRPLPTAYFLREDRRTFLRMSRRPSDVPLLVIRVMFAATLGACFAGVTWTAERSGIIRAVLVDAGAVAAPGADSLTALVEAATADAEAVGLEWRIIAYARDEDGALQTSSDPASLVGGGVSGAPALDALGALRSAMSSEAGLDSAEVVWITRPTWRQWTRGVGLLREAIWPGAVRIVAVPTGATATRAASMATVSTVGFPPDAPVHRALTALGIDLVEPGRGASIPADLYVTQGPSEAELRALTERALAGATVVLASVRPRQNDGTQDAGAIMRPGRRPIGGGGASASTGVTAPGARVLAVFEDTRPAASARALGSGCLVYAAFSLDDENLTRAPGYVDLVDDLSRGCATSPEELPLDQGTLSALERNDLSDRVALAGLGDTPGRPLTSVLIALALALLAAEVLLTRRRST